MFDPMRHLRLATELATLLIVLVSWRTHRHFLPSCSAQPNQPQHEPQGHQLRQSVLPGHHVASDPYHRQPQHPYTSLHGPVTSYEEDASASACCLDTALESPLLATVLFLDKCPIEITNKTVCEAVSLALGMPDSALFPRTDVNTTALILEPLEEHGDQDVHFTGNYDIAVISAGMCFNIYPNVRYGDEVPFECTDAALSREALAILDYSSIWTPGHLYLDLASESALPLYVGGNWEGTESFEANEVQAHGGCFPLYEIIIGGYVSGGGIPPGGGIISTVSGDPLGIALGGADPTQRILTAVVIISKEEVDAIKFEQSVKACALSKMIQSRKPTGTVALTVQDATSASLVISCPGDNPFCVVELDEGIALPFETIIAVTLNTDASEVVKINIPGKAQLGALDFQQATIVIPIIWNFFEADTVMLGVQGVVGATNMFYGSVLAPRAAKVVIDGSLGGGMDARIQGSVVLGHPESHLSLIGIIALSQASTSGYCPPAEPTIILCDCLCRQKKEKK